MITILLFVIGFVILVKGADLLVDASSSIAKRYGVSNLVIGLTIVAFGTSFPELIVSAFASLKGSTGVALGNIVGSNISNILLVLGVSAVIHPLYVKKNTVSKEIPLSLLAVFAVSFLVNDQLIDGALYNYLTRIDGLILILFFSIFIYYTFGISKEEVTLIETLREEKIEIFSLKRSLGMIVIGLILLYFGGEWIVNGALELARTFGISEAFVGLTVVAIGTSLPELAASGMAAYRGKADIAVGNAVGSNIFNLFWVLGVSSVIAPIPHNLILNYDLIILMILTIVLLLLIFIGKKNILGRWEGGALLFIYLCYFAFLIYRG